MKNWHQVYVQIFSQAVIIIFLNIVVIPLDYQSSWTESTAYLTKKSARNDGISGLGIRLEKSDSYTLYYWRCLLDVSKGSSHN